MEDNKRKEHLALPSPMCSDEGCNWAQVHEFTYSKFWGSLSDVCSEVTACRLSRLLFLCLPHGVIYISCLPVPE